MAVITRGEKQDIHYSFYEDKEQIQDMAVKAYLRGVEIAGLSETIMITPMRRNEGITVDGFNKIIQSKLIKDKSVFVQGRKGMTPFYIGDKIIQNENDYSGKGVINGEIGYITQIYEKYFSVQFPDKEVNYINEDYTQIDLAYCISGHKYQGSQAKIVIIVMHISNYIMLSKQWLYTAITRGIDTDYIIAHPQAWAMAIQTDHAKRRTFLQYIIKENKL